MKTLFLFLLLTLALLSGQAQKVDTLHRNIPVDGYLKKRAAFNTTGWILLGVGIATAGYSYLNYANNGFNGTWKLEPLFFVGGGMAIASVPFFVLARANKVKAGLALKEERLLPGTVFAKPKYPALSLQLQW